MKNLSSILLFSGICLFLSLSYQKSRASEDVERIISNATVENCEQTFSEIWSLAKGGDIKARIALHYSFFWVGLKMPGTGQDSISWEYDSLLRAIYAADIKGSIHDKTLLPYIYTFKSDDDYYNCLNEEKESCSDILVKHGQIPAYKEYADKIDAFLKSGFKPTCVGGLEHGYPHDEITIEKMEE